MSANCIITPTIPTEFAAEAVPALLTARRMRASAASRVMEAFSEFAMALRAGHLVEIAAIEAARTGRLVDAVLSDFEAKLRGATRDLGVLKAAANEAIRLDAKTRNRRDAEMSAALAAARARVTASDAALRRLDVDIAEATKKLSAAGVRDDEIDSILRGRGLAMGGGEKRASLLAERDAAKAEIAPLEAYFDDVLRDPQNLPATMPAEPVAA